jgi:hypothetical protein
MSIGGDPFFMVGSDILDIGSRKNELRGRRNRISPLEHPFGSSIMPSQFMVPNVPNVRKGCSSHAWLVSELFFN